METPNNRKRVSSCRVTVNQRSRIYTPVTVTPVVSSKAITVRCSGSPVITPTTPVCPGIQNKSCSFTIEQDIRVSIPIEFGANAIVGDSDVRCGSISPGGSNPCSGNNHLKAALC